MLRPSRLKTISRTGERWRKGGLIDSPVANRQRKTKPSEEPAATVRPSGLNATTPTGDENLRALTS
jgi:hypothetical protein